MAGGTEDTGGESCTSFGANCDVGGGAEFMIEFVNESNWNERAFLTRGSLLRQESFSDICKYRHSDTKELLRLIEMKTQQ